MAAIILVLALALGSAAAPAVRAADTAAPAWPDLKWMDVQVPTANLLTAVADNYGEGAATGKGGTLLVLDQRGGWQPASVPGWTPADLEALAAKPTGNLNAYTAWVAVGKAGSILGAVARGPWQNYGTAAGAGPMDDLYAVAYDNAIVEKQSTIVAVGRAIFTRRPGATWSRTTPADMSGTLYGVVYAHGLFVAVGQPGILTSADGLAWVSRYRSRSDLMGVAYGNNQFVAIAASGAVLTSPDGIAWATQQTSLQQPQHIAATLGKYFVTTASSLYMSGDGLNWAPVALPSLPANVTPTLGGITPDLRIPYQGGYFRARVSSPLTAADSLPPCSGAVKSLQQTPGDSWQVGVARPLVQMSLGMVDGATLVGGAIVLDGKPVPVEVDPLGLVTYRAPAPLAPGSHWVHTAALVQQPDGKRCIDTDSPYEFQIAPGALPALPAASPQSRHAVAYLNDLRAAAGLPPVTTNQSLSAAADHHAQYVTANREPGHHEQPDHPLYTGYSPQERAVFFGYNGGAGEDAFWGGTVDAEFAVDGWLETLYHRIPLVRPQRMEAGYGAAQASGAGSNILEFGWFGPPGELSRWPYDGQTDVPTSWDGGESPDPFRLYPGVFTFGTTRMGYPITLTFGRPPVHLTLTAASLTEPGGTAVPLLTFAPGQDPYLSDSVAVIPRAPLQFNRVYTVRFEGEIDYGAGARRYTQTWSFTTEPFRLEGGGWNKFGQTQALYGAGFTPGMQIYLGGLPVQNVQFESDGKLTFDVPLPLDYQQNRRLPLTVVSDGKAVEGEAPVIFREPAFGAADFSPVVASLVIGGQKQALDGLRHRDGQIVVSEQALQWAGVDVQYVDEPGIIYLAAGERTAQIRMGGLLFNMDGQQRLLAMPPLELDGARYVPLALVEAMVGSTAAVTAPPVPADQISVVLNGSPVDTRVLILDGRSLVPLRDLATAMGFDIDWNGETRTIRLRKEDVVVTLRVGAYSAAVGDREVALDIPAILVDGRTQVPLRFISEALAAAVRWDAATQTIFVNHR